jgi:uncharacterized protein with FMN-binding domain
MPRRCGRSRRNESRNSPDDRTPGGRSPPGSPHRGGRCSSAVGVRGVAPATTPARSARSVKGSSRASASLLIRFSCLRITVTEAPAGDDCPAAAEDRMTPTRPPGDGRAATRRWTRGARPGRVANSLVVLTSAAIVSVYAVGYARTQSAEDQITGADVGLTQALQVTPTPTAKATGAPSPTSQAAGGAQSTATAGTTSRPAATATPKPAATPTAATGYRDGTYTGSGTSRHGGVTVSLVVSGGKIKSAAITSCQTRYPCSQISSLQGQVISRQSAKIDHVSGATDSSTAYRQAVAAALAKANV